MMGKELSSSHIVWVLLWLPTFWVYKLKSGKTNTFSPGYHLLDVLLGQLKPWKYMLKVEYLNECLFEKIWIIMNNFLDLSAGDNLGVRVLSSNALKEQQRFDFSRFLFGPVSSNLSIISEPHQVYHGSYLQVDFGPQKKFLCKLLPGITQSTISGTSSSEIWLIRIGSIKSFPMIPWIF